MSIRNKLIIFLACIGSLATLLMIGGAIWSNSFHFELEITQRFRVIANLVQLNLSQLINDKRNGLKVINDNKDLTRQALVALAASQPKRTNFFRYFLALGEFVNQYSAAQATVHFISAKNPNFQIYGAYQQERLYSFSPVRGENGQGLLELEIDNFGLVLPKKGHPQKDEFILPLNITEQQERIRFFPSQQKLYLDLHYPLINHSMGSNKNQSNGFAYLGLVYGVIRTFVELSPEWLHKLEEETGVKLDIYLDDGTHVLGDLNTHLDIGHFTHNKPFKQTVNEIGYIQMGTPIEVEGELLGYLVTSIPQSFLVNQVLDMSGTLLVIGGLILILSIFLASVLSFFLVRPIKALEQGAHQLAFGDLTYPIDTQQTDEIGHLAKSFAKMRDAIYEKIQEIERKNIDLSEANQIKDDLLTQLRGLNENLEKLVEERTGELSATVSELEKQHQQLKQTQTQLVHSEKMAGLGTLVAGVAHEINNPTNYMHISTQALNKELQLFKDTFFELLQESNDLQTLQYFEEQFGRFFKSLENINNGSMRIKTIVQDLRMFSRLGEADKKTANIAENLESTLRLIQTQYKEIVKFVCDFQTRPTLECYPSQLNQVFMNILTNACQAIQQKQRQGNDNGKGTVMIGIGIENNQVIIRIQDNGPGMDQTVQQKIFEPFFTTKDVGEGTGMGLSISYGIMEKHQGSIQVESEIDEGTTVTLSLPLR